MIAYLSRFMTYNHKLILGNKYHYKCIHLFILFNLFKFETVNFGKEFMLSELDAIKINQSRWGFSSWMGTFYHAADDWIYHESLNWLYPSLNSAKKFWIYSKEIDWFFTNAHTYPYIYINKSNSWFFLDKERGIYDYSTKSYLNSLDFKKENWRHRLYTPTYLTKINDFYIISDCWHHRLIYTKSIENELIEWNTLDDNVMNPHSVATDGRLLVYEDTGRGNIKYVQIQENGFGPINTLNDVGSRPHRIIYDPATEIFFTITSGDQTLHVIKNKGMILEIERSIKLHFLKNSYCRSISIIDDFIYFTSGGGSVFQTSYVDGELALIKSFSTPVGFESMNDVYKSKSGWFYFTSTSGRMICRSKSILSFSKGQYEDLSETIGLSGTPYYLSEFDDRLYVPQITEHSGIIWIHEQPNGVLEDCGKLFDSGPPNTHDKARRSYLQ